MFSDRTSPDYRNSMKESICAVEAVCRSIAGKPNATLGDALAQIQIRKKVQLHKDMRGALDKLFAYTNDADGIRHALKDDPPSAGFDDAKFMLVTCSAFVNYLISKATAAGITL